MKGLKTYVGISLIPFFFLLSFSASSKPASPKWKQKFQKLNRQQYQVKQGDTLSAISRRVLGTARYWPHIWAINHQKISNPHLLEPGMTLSFRVAENTYHQPDARSSSYPKPQRSQEWKKLPTQPWERFNPKPPENIEPKWAQGTENIFAVRQSKIHLSSIGKTNEPKTYGEIVASRSQGQFITQSDIVFIESAHDLKAGRSFTVTQEPRALNARASDRFGYAYPLLGKVKILAAKGDQYVGRITQNQQPVRRGSFLIEQPLAHPSLTPKAGPTPLEGVVMIDPEHGKKSVVQHEQAFIDRGKTDGIKPGMVFRVYQHHDPELNEKMTSQDFIIAADLLVVNTSEDISTTLVIHSKRPVRQGEFAVLLTDVSDLSGSWAIPGRSSESKKPTTEMEENRLDDLDALDSSGSLSEKQRKELDQLENWRGNPEKDISTQDQELDNPPPSSSQASDSMEKSSEKSSDRSSPDAETSIQDSPESKEPTQDNKNSQEDQDEAKEQGEQKPDKSENKSDGDTEQLPTFDSELDQSKDSSSDGS